MTIKRIVPATLAALLGIAALGGAAYAKDQDGQQDGRDVKALADMKVTLPQAIATAERQAGGRAVSADVTQDQGAARIAVEVAGPQGVKTVMVDAQSGQVVATAAGGGQDAEEND